jgi:transcriptional regulator with XRE-family HTH domain
MPEELLTPKADREPVNLEALYETPERMELFREASDAIEAAALIRRTRELVNISQAELARRLGVTQPRMSIIEKGDGPNGPTYAMLKRVARACGVTFDVQVNGRSLLAATEDSEDAPQPAAVATALSEGRAIQDSDDSEEGEQQKASATDDTEVNV